ncbi:hypothetical protein PIB30_003115 [Stylosanthes scabra]|uniref:Zinc finger GRF-type domain-containing protein n=1 Tax=Stylosanthes scabra TaxID=79078 RepID=A0ABU6Y217_9FABA|nr:hypothetical protein [Stylosanthes scabra]
MNLSQGDSLVYSSRSSMVRSINNHKRRHLHFCGKELVVMSFSTVNSHGKRYVVCGRMPKCNLFEWIDDEEERKSGLTKPMRKRIRCFCEQTLTLRTSEPSRLQQLQHWLLPLSKLCFLNSC